MLIQCGWHHNETEIMCKVIDPMKASPIVLNMWPCDDSFHMQV
jgi:hypothetical protein